MDLTNFNRVQDFPLVGDDDDDDVVGYKITITK
jgi:hypothetical protein